MARSAGAVVNPARASAITATLHPPRPAPNQLTEPLAQVLARAPADWAPLVQTWQASNDGQRLLRFIGQRQAEGARIYPAAVLRSLELSPRAQVRVVLLGQDPYHGAGQAEGLAFSVPPGVRPPPSLRNILGEISRSLGVPHLPDGHLGGWARQGVLLLNTVLTVEDGQPAAHAGQGWESFTDAVIQAAASDPGAKVFLLWGGHAQAKAGLVQPAGAGRHLVLQANHPSPLSARRPPTPFIGCGHFTQLRDFLAAAGAPPIRWSA